MKLTDLAPKDLLFDSFLERYNLVIEDEDTIADVIYRFLFSDNSVINLDGGEITPDEVKEHYFSRLKKQVSKGAPIDFLLTTFSPKFKKENISNGWIEPDVADLITLVHLQMLAKTIREIYPYNFRFIIAYKGDLYQRVGGWTDNELTKTFDILQQLNQVAEEITGTRNSVLLKRWDEMFADNIDDFESRWELKSEYYYRLWSDKKEPYFTQIERWKKDFLPYLDIDDKFLDVFDFFLTKEGSRIRAFNNLIFREGQALDLLQKLHPNLLIAHTRKKSKFFNILLNPYFQSRTHLKMAVLDGEWKMKAWSEIKFENYTAKYVEEFEFPFYFEIKKTE